jgi:hypothetical protein
VLSRQPSFKLDGFQIQVNGHEANPLSTSLHKIAGFTLECLSHWPLATGSLCQQKRHTMSRSSIARSRS